MTIKKFLFGCFFVMSVVLWGGHPAFAGNPPVITFDAFKLAKSARSLPRGGEIVDLRKLAQSMSNSSQVLSQSSKNIAAPSSNKMAQRMGILERPFITFDSLTTLTAAKAFTDPFKYKLEPILPEKGYPLLRSTFQAREMTNFEYTNGFSGTIFKTVYNGQEEIYGVVAAHAIAKTKMDQALKKIFIADIYVNGKFISIPAEIVQVSAPDILDIALVKFSPKDEALLTPLTIAGEEPAVGDILQTQGFTSRHITYIPGRQLLKKTPFSLRTDISLPRHKRLGLCGAPIVNVNDELVGIHVGSTQGIGGDESKDIGYVCPARYLNTLVEAYHNGGKATFSLEMDGHKMLDLEVDQFISSAVFFDENGEELDFWVFGKKFAYESIREALNIFHPRYIEFQLHRVGWGGEQGNHLSSNLKEYKVYVYDFKTQQGWFKPTDNLSAPEEKH